MLKKNPFRQWLPQATATLAITLGLTLSSNLWATAVDNSQAPSAAKQTSDKALTPGKATASSASLAALTQNNATYSYDELGRLSQITVNGKLVTEYQYDAVGNRTQKQHHQ
ncbi:RHS repeat domain-containing protein [Thalassomonas sp. RHCl1]|uniref:RHS repeat domain-containing protein n=1 Tax=Thalassomonas sp. RHCl1 TaxID=2995320 RepID=UPI00248B8FB6|nr:RHS repeat domain-containing protein [Thalassomonas sp. RHCl1]